MTLSNALNHFRFLSDVHAVGGAVRDTVLGVDYDDIDFATSDRPDTVVRKLTDRGIDFTTVGIDHGTVVAMIDGDDFDITTFRKDMNQDGRHADVVFCDDIRDDLARRDLTINALAMDVDGNIIDHFGGINDLDRGIIRTVGDPMDRFQQDFLRIVRAARYANRFDFRIADDTRTAMGTLADRVLDNVSVNRIVMDIKKSFKDPTSSKFIRILYDLGILQGLIPQFAGMDTLMQNPNYHPQGDVFSHILKVIDRAPATPKHRFHALLHDIGKSVAHQPVDGNPWNTFHRHAVVGARMIPDIAKRLKISNDLRDSIQAVTRLHMRPLNCHDPNGNVTDRAVRRFQRDAGDYLSDIQVLATADHDRGDSPLFDDLDTPTTPILMGRHLIDAGMSPGPHFGPALDAAFDAQINDGVSNRSDLLDIAIQQIGA